MITEDSEAVLFGLDFEGETGFVSGREEHRMAFQANVDAVLFCPDCPLGLRHSSFHLLGVLTVNSSQLNLFL